MGGGLSTEHYDALRFWWANLRGGGGLIRGTLRYFLNAGE